MYLPDLILEHIFKFLTYRVSFQFHSKMLRASLKCPKSWTLPLTWSNYAPVWNGKLAQEWPGLYLAIHNHHYHQRHIVDQERKMCSMTCFTWSLVFNRRSIWAHLTIFGDTMCTWRYNCANMEHQVFLRLVAALACVTPSRHSESELPTLFGVFFPCILSHKCFAAALCVYSFVPMV